MSLKPFMKPAHTGAILEVSTDGLKWDEVSVNLDILEIITVKYYVLDEDGNKKPFNEIIMKKTHKGREITGKFTQESYTESMDISPIGWECILKKLSKRLYDKRIDKLFKEGMKEKWIEFYVDGERKESVIVQSA